MGFLHAVWAIVLWLAVFILIPLERIKQLWIVAVITSIWLFIVNYFSIRLGYYSFHKMLVPIFGSPLFVLIGVGAAGILLMNWMQRHPLYKIFIIFIFSSF